MKSLITRQQFRHGGTRRIRKLFFYGLMLIAGLFYLPHQKIMAQGTSVSIAEYYFDTDPGMGNGTALSITQGPTINESAGISLNSLSAGFHNMGIRTRDNLGNWSLAEARPLYIYTAPPSPSQIAVAEYYFDTDPGTGHGTPLSITQGATVNQNSVIPLSGLLAGFHTMSPVN